MEKLTSKEIRFIDTYLKKSGINFLDVRIEMTDHVASAVEDDLEKDPEKGFYRVFKSYMVKNKKSLIKNSNGFSWAVDKRVLLGIQKELFSVPGIFVGLGFLLLFSNFNVAELWNSLWFAIPSLIVFLGAYFVPVILFQKLKISFLNRLSVYAYLINYLFYLILDHFEPAAKWLAMYYSILVWLNFGVVRSAFKMSAVYKKHFAGYEKA